MNECNNNFTILLHTQLLFTVLTVSTGSASSHFNVWIMIMHEYATFARWKISQNSVGEVLKTELNQETHMVRFFTLIPKDFEGAVRMTFQ